MSEGKRMKLIEQQQQDKQRLKDIQTQLNALKTKLLALETEKERIEQQIAGREQEIRDQANSESDISQIQLQEEGQLGILKEIWFFPSWNQLIDTNFKGFYLNQPVMELKRDSVLLIPDITLTGTDETTGEAFILVVGVGVYYAQFSISLGKIITDFREICGIVLPTEAFIRAQDQASSTINSQKLEMTEYMTKIPFTFLLERETTQMYMRGVVTRNIMHPNKEIFDLLEKLCKSKTSLSEEEGFKILSGGLSAEHSIYKNELLTEKQIPEYSRITAGLKNVKPTLGKIMSTLQLEEMRAQIFKNIKQIKHDYTTIGLPRLRDWMP